MFYSRILTLALYCFISCLSVSILKAQHDFRPGYVITLEGDTLKGEVAYRANLLNYKRCLFRQGAEKRSFTPQEIKAFAYIGDKKFSSQIIDSTFAEVLVEGELSLYRYQRDAFALQKKDSAVKKLEITATKFQGRREVRYDDKRWLGKVIVLMQDCMPDERTLERLDFREKDLTRLVKDYHACRNLTYVNPKGQKSASRLRVGILGGARLTHLRFKEQSNLRRVWDFTQTTVSPAFGVLLNLTVPRLNEHFSIQIEPQVYSFSYAASNTSVGFAETYTRDMSLEQRVISIPLTLNFNVIGDFLYLNGGVNFEFYPNPQGDYARQISRNVNPDNPFSDVEVVLDERMAGEGFDGIFGVGAKRNFSGYIWDLSLRYYFKTQNVFDNSSVFSGNMHQLGLMLSVSKDLIQRK